MKKREGDTLIEVIFAFAILATIIGFAFTGVINARKTAVSAQERTQALEFAQYQTEALKAYRISLPWDSEGGINNPSFLDGGNGGNAKINTDGVSVYCMKSTSANGSQYWQLVTNLGGSNCNSLTPYLTLQDSNSAITRIVFRPIGSLNTSGTSAPSGDTVQAEITVNWIDRFNQNQSVQDIVILTKQQ